MRRLVQLSLGLCILGCIGVSTLAEDEAAPELVEDAALGIKVTVKGLKEMPLNSGGTLFTAYYDGDPGDFLEVEYLVRPTGFEQYLKDTELGFSMFEAKQRESKEITLDGRKARWRVYDGELEGPTTIFQTCLIPESDKQPFWSVSGMCSGKDRAEREKAYTAAIQSFAVGTGKPAKASKSLYESKAFGFRIDLSGFKGPNKGPENALLVVRGLYEGTKSLGTFGVIAAAPFDNELTKHVDKVVEGHERAKRKIVSRKEQDCSGRKAVLLEYEYDQAGRPTKVQQLVLLEYGVALSVSGSWRPADCKGGKEQPLLDAIKSFALTRPAETTQPKKEK